MHKIFTLLSITFCLAVKAQDSSNVTTTISDKPVRNTFYSNTLMYQQTVETPVQGGMELFIAHRFGPIDDGFQKLFGIYGKSNIRMSFSYGITDKIMVGIGSTMPSTWDLHGKIAILKQTKSNSIPVSVSLFANAAVNIQDKSSYDIYTSYSVKHRFSYFYQLMIARKFGNIASLQVSPILAYYNAVEKDKDNMTFGIESTGRVKVYNSISFIAQYSQALPAKKYSKPGGSAGLEITTPTHSFQVFLTNYYDILQQANLGGNINTFGKGNIGIGFNLTIRL